MKFIGKILVAFLLTSLYWSVVQQYCTSPRAVKLTHWIYTIPFWYQVFFWAVVFVFPTAIGQVLTLLGNAVMQGLTFAATSTSQLLERLWKYRAGQILIGSLIAYLAYIIIF